MLPYDTCWEKMWLMEGTLKDITYFSILKYLLDLIFYFV